MGAHTMMRYADLSEAERAFRALLEDERAYAAWARGVRARWLRTAPGLLAKLKAPERTGKKHRRVDLEEKNS